MNKIVKAGLIILCILASCLFILFGLSVLLENKIKAVVVSEINKSLNTPVSVGEIEFSVIRHFPYASLQFKNMEAKGNVVNGSKDPLLKAEKLDLLFNLLSVFYESYELKKVVVENASLNILTDKEGNRNFDVFKKREQNKESGKTSFEMCVLKNVAVVIDDRKNNLLIDADIAEAKLNGSFAEEKFVMNTEGVLLSKNLSYDNIHYIKNKHTNLKAGIEIDTKNKHYAFKEAQLKIASLDLTLNGFIDNKDETFVDINVESKKAKANELLSSLPSTWIAPELLEYSYKGDVYFSASIKGKAAIKNPPLIEVRFGAQSLDIIPDKENYALRKVALAGFFTNKKSDKNPVSYLSLKNVKALLEGKNIKAEIILENLKNPFVDITIDADASLASLSRYFPSEFTEQQKGIISFHGNIKGRGDKKETYRSSGKMSFSGIGFKVKNRPLAFNDVSGELLLDGSAVNIHNLNGHAGVTDFSIQATLGNFYNYIFNPGQVISIQGSIRSSYIDMAAFMQSEGKKTDSTGRIDFPNDIALNLNVNADKASFRKFVATNVTGNITLKNKTLSTNSLNFYAVDGSIKLQGSINANAKDSLLIAYNASLNNLDIQRLFSEMGNFGQQTITDKNLKGQVTASVEFASVWSKTLEVNSKNIYARSTITIDNGELNNFYPMLKLSRFVKGTDLRNVKFSTLKNQIEIKERKIFIPSMDIKSSALNMSVSGTHSFDNIVDYKIQMKLNQLLGKKVRDLNTEFGTIEDDGRNGMTLFLTMKGPADNPKFAYDRKGVETKVTNSVKAGKDDFIKTLKDEFSGRNKENPAEKEKEKKQKELELEPE